MNLIKSCRSFSLACQWLAFVAIFSVSVMQPVFSKAILNGNKIALAILEKARAGENPVSLGFLSNRVCVLPEGGMAEPGALRLFPGDRIVSSESDKSEGVWFVALKEDPLSDEVKIFAISQRELRWTIDEDNDRYRDLLMCPTGIEIDLSADVPTVRKFIRN